MLNSKHIEQVNALVLYHLAYSGLEVPMPWLFRMDVGGPPTLVGHATAVIDLIQPMVRYYSRSIVSSE